MGLRTFLLLGLCILAAPGQVALAGVSGERGDGNLRKGSGQSRTDGAAALTTRGKELLFGERGEANATRAMELFAEAAALGDPYAQSALGFGWLGRIRSEGTRQEDHVGKALLHLYFAASSGSSEAQLALGFRHLYGLSVPKSCQTAVLYYHPVARKVVEDTKFTGAFSGVEQIRLASLDVLPLRINQEEQLIEFYQYSADMGDVSAQTAVGELLKWGIYGMERDHAKALHYFTRAAEQGDMDAAAQLGHMHANGLGVPQDNEAALTYFRQAAERGHPMAYYGLGYMHLAGFGVEQNNKVAYKYFSMAAEHGSTEAHFHVGAMKLGGIGVTQDNAGAFHHFSQAAHQGHLIALYNLALMHMNGLGVPVSCQTPVVLLKNVAERGRSWGAFLSGARSAYNAGDYHQALVKYLHAAEMGYEVGQSNAAYMLQRGLGASQHLYRNRTDMALKALEYHQMAAEQGNVQSMVDIGDAFYYGRGIDENMVKAVSVYTHASKHKSAQATFNLGYMHEQGLGVGKDVHLAKRHYETASKMNRDAYFPARLALMKLEADKWLEEHGCAALAAGLLRFVRQQTWITSVMDLLIASVPTLSDELFMGYDTDTVLIALLCLAISILLCWRSLRLAIQHDPYLQGNFHHN